MRLFGRLPGWVWGIVGTAVAISLLLAYASRNGDSQADAADTSGPVKSEASQDSEENKEAKKTIEHSIKAFVMAALSVKPGMNVPDYLDRMEPLATTSYLTEYERRLKTPIEQAYINGGYTILVTVFADQAYGHFDDSAKNASAEGFVPVSLVGIDKNGNRSPMGCLNYELVMFRDESGNWLANSFTPQDTCK